MHQILFSLLKKLLLLFTFGILISITYGQSTYSDRYLNSYKQYDTLACPIPKYGIKHFGYFSRDREKIKNHAFLKLAAFKGAQIMYSWRQLEPKKGKYDFSEIWEDYRYLRGHGKKLFIQLQDATFDTLYHATPAYIRTKKYDGGASIQYDDSGNPEGWVAKRWNDSVAQRFVLLLKALGKEFDGKIEGINLQETAIGEIKDTTFSFDSSLLAIQVNMLALKKAFSTSVSMQYANFMPGEFLPADDKGYLRNLYAFGQKIGVGLGAPDLMVQKRGQLNHALALMHEHYYTVPLGIAVQDGNYIGKTNNNTIIKSRKSLVPMLSAFANDFLKVDYMFWGVKEPYFTEDVVPCFAEYKYP